MWFAELLRQIRHSRGELSVYPAVYPQFALLKYSGASILGLTRDANGVMSAGGALPKFAILCGALAFSASALAADIAPKMFVKAPLPVYSRTGFYIGGDVGYGWGNANDGFAFNPVADLTGGGHSQFKRDKGGIVAKPIIL